jgi:hypothetical protein
MCSRPGPTACTLLYGTHVFAKLHAPWAGCAVQQPCAGMPVVGACGAGFTTVRVPFKALDLVVSVLIRQLQNQLGACLDGVSLTCTYYVVLHLQMLVSTLVYYLRR